MAGRSGKFYKVREALFSMTRVIAISSGKGGVGKTTTAINLAAAFNILDQDVLLIDGSLTTPDIGVYLGAPIIPIGVHDVLSGKKDAGEAIYEHHSGMRVMPASISLKELRNVRPEKLSEVVRGIREDNDIIIIDSAAGLGRETYAVLKAADELIVVTSQDLPSVTNALKTAKIAEELGKSVLGVVVTRATNREDVSLKNINTMFERPILAVIPEDNAVKLAVSLKDAVMHTAPKSKASKSYMKLAQNLLGIKPQNSWFEDFMSRFQL